MTVGAWIALAALVALYLGFELGLLYLLKRGFRWIADKIDRDFRF